MSRPRTELSKILRATLGSDNVYFQPPASKEIKYPCIIYSLDKEWTEKADNTKYLSMKRYTVTVVDKNSESLIPDKISELEFCSMDRTYISDNLNHFVFTIYF